MFFVVFVTSFVVFVTRTATVSAQECEYLQQYTDCIDGKRCLLQYQIPPCSCACTLDPYCGLPCNVQCGLGEYMNTTGYCQQCDAGTFSNGGAMIYDATNFASTFSDTFATGCQINRVVCTNSSQGWQVKSAGDGSTFIDSGNFIGIDNVIASLFLSATFVTNGSITYDFRVEAEANFDGMTFAIDGSPASAKISTVSKLTTVSYNVSAGYHIFTWVYQKDSSITVTPDHAQLYRIVIQGTSDFVDSCTSCAPGSSTNGANGATACTLCDYNTYSSQLGSPSCSSCNSTSYSFLGATSCTPKTPCTVAEDMIQVVGDCESINSQLVRPYYYIYEEPQTCDQNNSQSQPLPENGTIPCEPCNPGEIRDIITAECTPCPVGYHRATFESECTPCGPGTAAVGETVYDYFYESIVSADFLRYCTPAAQCTDSDGLGWRAMNQYIDTGRNHGAVDMTLSLTAQILANDGDGNSASEDYNSQHIAPEYAGINFQFTTTCLNYYDCVLYFYVDNVEVTNVRRIFNKANNSIVVNGLSLGWHEFRWVFHKVSSTVYNSYVSIDYISVIGTGGGADACLPCPPGRYSTGNLSYCYACPAGSTNSPDYASCSDCPINQYAPVSASPQCYHCDQGTFTAEPASTDCDYNGCTFTVSSPTLTRTYTYDLSPLSLNNGDWGPVKDAYRSTFSYYVNLCNRYHNNSKCRDNKAGKSLETFVCQLTGTEAINLGEVLGFYPLPLANITDGLLVRFSSGASQGCQNNSSRTTNLTMICDQTQNPGVFSTMTEVSTCQYRFTWRTIYACYVCGQDDYEELKTECLDGYQNISYRWNEPKQCVFGLPLPTDYVLTCGSSNEPQIIEKSKGVSVASVAALSVVVFVVVVILGVLIYKYNELRKQKLKMWALGENDVDAANNANKTQYKQFQDEPQGTNTGSGNAGSINK